MNAKERIRDSKKLYLEALKAAFGNISVACDKIGIARRTYYNWVEDDEAFSKLCADIDEKNLDFAESTLLRQVREGNTTALIFYLKTKGKRRGYIERQENAFVGDSKIVVELKGRK